MKTPKAILILIAGVSLAAQAATLPWILPLTGGLHPLAPLLNLVAVPYLALFLSAAFLWLAAGAVSETTGAFLGPLMEGLAAPVAGLTALAPVSAWFRALDPGGGVLFAWLLPAVLVWALSWPPRLGRGLLVGILLLQAGSRPLLQDGRGVADYVRLKEPLPKPDLERLIALYDGEIAWTDRHVGELLDELDALVAAEKITAAEVLTA